MVNTLARIKKMGKNFEIVVDMDSALKLKKGENVSIAEVLQVDGIFYDSKKGLHASDEDLTQAFGSEDIQIVAEKIVKQGEIQSTQEHRSQEKEAKIKQVVDFLSRNALNPITNQPHTPERIKQALDQAGINVDNRPIEAQVPGILDKLKEIIPLKLDSKQIRITIPSQYTGQVYNLVKDYKEKEDWKDDGSLIVVLNLPVGLQMDFYDKLNSITHGSGVVEEIGEKNE